MEPIIWMCLGAAGVVSLILVRLGAKHGLAWVRAQLKQHATEVESDFKKRVSGAIGDLDARIRDVVHSELAKIESDVAGVTVHLGSALPDLAGLKADVASLKTRAGI